MRRVDISALQGLTRHPLNSQEIRAVFDAIKIIEALVPISACKLVRDDELARDEDILRYVKNELCYEVGKYLYANGFIHEERHDYESGCVKIVFRSFVVRNEDHEPVKMPESFACGCVIEKEN